MRVCVSMQTIDCEHGEGSNLRWLSTKAITAHISQNTHTYMNIDRHTYTN